MKILGIKTIQFKKLQLPGDLRTRLESPRVYERAQSIKRLGNLSEPMVRKSDYRIAYGRDRIAAMMLLGKTEGEVKLVECTDKELAEIEAAENCERRHSLEEQRVARHQLLGLYEEMISEAPRTLNPDQKLRIQPVRGLKRQAVEKLANELGVKPQSLKKRLQRDRRLKRQRAAEHLEITGEEPPEDDLGAFELIGMQVEETFLRQVRDANRHITDLAVKLHATRISFGYLLNSGLPLPMAKLARLAEDISALSATMRGARPAALCPYCKGLPGIQERCTACVQTGWICVDQTQGVPHELWAEGVNAIVSEGGRHRRVLDIMAELQEPEEPTALDRLQEAEELLG